MDLREEALKLHRDNHGKLSMISKVPLRNGHDLSLAYTPGVAEPCKEITVNKDLSFEYTCRGNMVAVVTDGTRVLGLGDIGPEAAIPVMEGKSVLFKVFGDIDAVPICLATKDPEKIIETVKLLQPNFAGINLEDISSPKCYDIEDTLKKELAIPVFHDDQHGTAIAALAATIGALRLVNKDLATVRIVVNGAGAAGTAIGRLLIHAGAKNVIMVNRSGILRAATAQNRIQEELVKVTNPDNLSGGVAEAANGADVLMGVSSAGLFTAEIIAAMGRDPIVMAMANPVPEISYQAAKAAGAKVAGTGRSDAPNQVNNVAVFPGVFRGAIDVRARQINEDMKLAAAYALAGLLADDELREDYVIPDAFDSRVAPAVAAAVAEAAIKTGVARLNIDPAVIKANTAARINHGRRA